MRRQNGAVELSDADEVPVVARLVDELDNATLVTYEGVGHTAYGEGSDCVDDAVDQYLLKGTVPKKDLVCS